MGQVLTIWLPLPSGNRTSTVFHIHNDMFFILFLLSFHLALLFRPAGLTYHGGCCNYKWKSPDFENSDVCISDKHERSRVFWVRTYSYVSTSSPKFLHINKNEYKYTQMYAELYLYSKFLVTSPETYVYFKNHELWSLRICEYL